jgi:hypothetical protein
MLFKSGEQTLTSGQAEDKQGRIANEEVVVPFVGDKLENESSSSVVGHGHDQKYQSCALQNEERKQKPIGWIYAAKKVALCQTFQEPHLEAASRFAASRWIWCG